MRLFKVLPIVFFTLFGANIALAQFSILPDASDFGFEECRAQLQIVEADLNPVKSFMKDPATRNVILGCAIKTGQISFMMLPYFITYIANFMLSLGGIIAVLFIVIGGYYYIYGGVMDQKEKGKKTVIHALMGLVIGILSWVIVQVIITAVTS